MKRADNSGACGAAIQINLAEPGAGAQLAAAIGAIVPLIGAAVACAIGLFPGQWGHAGQNPMILLNETLGSELEVQESIAEGYATTIAINERRLSGFARSLKAAWLPFLISPAVAGAAFVAAKCLR